MAKLTLKVKKVQMKHPKTKEPGFVARVLTNGHPPTNSSPAQEMKARNCVAGFDTANSTGASVKTMVAMTASHMMAPARGR